MEARYGELRRWPRVNARGPRRSRRHWKSALSCAALSWAALCLAGLSPAAADVDPQAAQGGAPPAERRVGRLVRIPAPITDKVDERVRRIVDAVVTQAKKDGEWPVFIFEIEPGRTKFGPAFELAKFLSGPALNGATTVAYLPKSTSGHNVLVALACEEIVMAEGAEIGDAGEFEPQLEPSIRNAYVEIANRRKTAPADVALAMLDPNVELVRIETEVSREYVLADRIEELRQQRAFGEPVVVKPAGEPGVFSAQEAWDMGLVKYLADDRAAVAKALGLGREALEEDPSLDDEWRAARIDIHGPINDKMVERVQRMIQDEISANDTNFFCLWIDSAGGAPAQSVNLANYLANLDPGQRRTVAYVPKEARGDAAFIALACDQIVMHPGAMLGGSGAGVLTDDEIPAARKSLEDVARRKQRSPGLAAAMVDPQLSVFEYTRRADGLVGYFSEDELAEAGDADAWDQGPRVNDPGRPFEVDGDQAERFDLARHVVRDFDDFKARYGLGDDPALVEPGWAHTLIDALASPAVSWFLLLIGGAALYAELQSPGIGLGGLIAAVCFVIFFWAAYLNQTAEWLEALLFMLGLICLAIELLILPGFGVFGLVGGLLVLVSLVLASQTFVFPRNEYQFVELRNNLTMLVGAGVGIVVAATLIHRYLPHAPVLNRLYQAPPSGDELLALDRRESLADFSDLVGREGTTTTPVMPSGKARFGDRLVDVTADGEVIERGRRVSVVEVRGNRVVVREMV